MRTTTATYLPLGKFCASDAAASNASSERRDRCDDPGAALTAVCTLADRARVLPPPLFFGLLALVSYRPLGQQEPVTTPKLFAPGLAPRLASVSRIRFRFRGPAQAKQALRLCLRASKAALLRHLFAYASIDCYYHHRSRDVTCRRGTSAPDSSANPSRYPLLVAACRRERARSPPACRSELASPYYAPSAAARAKQDEREDPRRQADGRYQEKACRATKEPDELPLLEVRPA